MPADASSTPPRAPRGKTPALRLRMRVVSGDTIAIGPGKVELLEAIQAQRSITAAAKSLGMSYRRAWQLVEAMNRDFATPLVTTETGGRRGGGARPWHGVGHSHGRPAATSPCASPGQ